MSRPARLVGTDGPAYDGGMRIAPAGSRIVALVAIMLVVQAFLFWLSLTELETISVFCTASRSAPLAAVGYAHLVYFVLFAIGSAALRLPRLRVPYLVATSAALLLLPAQAWLVDAGYLYCDGP
jgi:hypothetical protein